MLADPAAKAAAKDSDSDAPKKPGRKPKAKKEAPKSKPKKEKTKAKKQEIEVLNAGASSSAGAGPSSSTADADSSDDEEGVPELSATLEAFSKLPLRGYEKSWEFIQNHRAVFVPGASDALLVAGFRAQNQGNAKYAKQCVHQSLLIQYCEKLGGDGPRLFFNSYAAFFAKPPLADNPPE